MGNVTNRNKCRVRIARRVLHRMELLPRTQEIHARRISAARFFNCRQFRIHRLHTITHSPAANNSDCLSEKLRRAYRMSYIMQLTEATSGRVIFAFFINFGSTFPFARRYESPLRKTRNSSERYSICPCQLDPSDPIRLICSPFSSAFHRAECKLRVTHVRPHKIIIYKYFGYSRNT